MLSIKNLYASIENKEILKGVNLEIKPGQIHVVMGPNGSGKSTLASVLAGNPHFNISSGSVEFLGQDITLAKPDERAQSGLFLAFQNPVEIPGVSVANALRLAYNNIAQAQNREQLDVPKFRDLLLSKMTELFIPDDFVGRSLNEGFSGGEKKKMEILQAIILEPKFLILDEIDSGLDIDALRVISNIINRWRGAGKSILLITHYQQILKYVEPDFVHVFMDGKILRSGGKDLVQYLEKKGYKPTSS